MTKPTPLPTLLAGLTVDDVEIARAHHTASPDVQAFMRHLADARRLTEAETALVDGYARLTPERRTLVEDLVRELGTPATSTDTP